MWSVTSNGFVRLCPAVAIIIQICEEESDVIVGVDIIDGENEGR